MDDCNSIPNSACVNLNRANVGPHTQERGSEVGHLNGGNFLATPVDELLDTASQSQEAFFV